MPMNRRPSACAASPVVPALANGREALLHASVAQYEFAEVWRRREIRRCWRLAGVVTQDALAEARRRRRKRQRITHDFFKYGLAVSGELTVDLNAVVEHRAVIIAGKVLAKSERVTLVGLVVSILGDKLFLKSSALRTLLTCEGNKGTLIGGQLAI
jgi:hypothetical protein